MQACASLPCRRPHGSLNNKTTLYLLFLRKEVIQPHLPIRLPCYDFTPVTGSTFDSSLQAVITAITLRPTLVSALYCCVSSSLHSTCYARHHFLALARISCAWNFVYHSDNHLVGSLASGISDSHGDGRCVQDPGTYSPRHSDSRLLAIPASCSRVADYSPNWDGLFVVRSPSRVRLTL